MKGNCEGSVEAEARDAFCKKLNEWITKKGAPALDCSKLSDVNYNKSQLPKKKTPGKCKEGRGPALEQVKGTFPSCKDLASKQWVTRARWESTHAGPCSGSPLSSTWMETASI